MQITLNSETLLFGIIVVLGFFAGMVLYTRRVNSSPNKYLGLFLISISLWLVDSFFRSSGIYGQDPDKYFLPIYYSFAFGPLLYFYVRSLVDAKYEFKKGMLWHFLPVLLQAILYVVLSFQSYEAKRWYWMEIHEPYTYRLEFDGTFVSLAIYLFFSIRLIRMYQSTIKESFSELSWIRLKWLQTVLSIMLVLCAVWFVEVLLRDVYDLYYPFHYTSLILGALTLVLAYGGISQPSLTSVDLGLSGEETTWTNSSIETETVATIADVMEKGKAYTTPALSLQQFAALCDIPPRKVSEAINKGYGKSFHDYVNQLRIEEVKTRLVTADLEMFTLTSIAYESGFNSKSSFNRIFKATCGMTPSQYVSQLSDKK